MVKLFHLFSATTSLILLSIISKAQVSTGGIPFTFTTSFSGAKSGIPHKLMPLIDNNTLQQQDAANPENSRYGIIHDVNIGLGTDGKWDSLTNGDRIWRLKIVSPTAYSIQLYYDQFYLKPGARFFIYNEDQSMVIGAFTSANNKASGLFATQPVSGESIILELYEPSGNASSSNIHINQIGHAYLNLFGLTVELAVEDECLIDVKCPQGNGWENQIRSVVMLLKKDQSGNLSYASGAMINNTNNNGNPYLLTAFHTLDVDEDCDIDATEEQNLEQWIFRFNYQLPACSSGTAPTDQTVTGAVLRARALTTDMALLELTEMPKNEYNVFLAGWNNSTSDVYESGVGIHHSKAKPKKISVTDIILITGTKGGGSCAQNDNVYWQVKYNLNSGVALPVSSGSPFFNVFGQIVGQLSRADRPSCTLAVPPDLTYYGKFSESWITSSDLANFLSPNSSNVTTLSGINLNDSPINTCANQIEDGDETGIDCGGAFCPPCTGSGGTGNPNDCEVGDIDMRINSYETGEPCIDLPIVLQPYGACANLKWFFSYTFTNNELCGKVPDSDSCTSGFFNLCDCKYFEYSITMYEVYENANIIKGPLYSKWFKEQRNAANPTTDVSETITIGQDKLNELGISLSVGKRYFIRFKGKCDSSPCPSYGRYFRVNPQDIYYTNTNLVSSHLLFNSVISPSSLANNVFGRNIILDNVTTTNYITPSNNNIIISASNSISITKSVITPGFIASIQDNPGCSEQRLANPDLENQNFSFTRSVYYETKPMAVKSSNQEVKANGSPDELTSTSIENLLPLITPNPSGNGRFTLSIQNENQVIGNLTVYNILGEPIHQQNITTSNPTIDISSQAKGIYFIKIQNENEFSIQKVVYQ